MPPHLWSRLQGGRTARHRLALAVVLALLMGASAAFGAAIASTLGGPTLPGPNAFQRSQAELGGPMPPFSLARSIDPAVVDVRAVVETPAGPSDEAGTGMIVSPDGEIITNNHVVAGAMRVEVRIAGSLARPKAGSPAATAHAGGWRPGWHAARFVGADRSDDLAVLQVEGASGLPTIELDATSQPFLGEGVLAIGNALGVGGTPAVTAGRISALGRSIVATSSTGADAEHLHGMIEASAAIDPGNSGGPLVSPSGRVVGMTTATSSLLGETSPLTFAIPARVIRSVLTEVDSGARLSSIARGRSAYLGATGSSSPLASDPGVTGVDLLQVQPNSPALQAGLEAGDVVIAVGGRPVTSTRQFERRIAAHRPGQLVTISFRVSTPHRVLRAVHTVRARLTPGPVP